MKPVTLQQRSTKVAKNARISTIKTCKQNGKIHTKWKLFFCRRHCNDTEIAYLLEQLVSIVSENEFYPFFCENCLSITSIFISQMKEYGQTIGGKLLAI